MAELTLNTNAITDMGELARLAYLEYGTSIKIGDEYFGSTNITDTETGAVETFHFNSRYTVIETTSSLTSMDAVLLKNEDTGKYVIAFRGTQEYGDVFTDLLIGVTSALTGTITAYNNQYSAANEFVNQMLLDYAGDGLTLSNLTLTGHSLGGILAQTIAAENELSAYTFNALGTSGLTRFNDTNGSKILNFSYTDDGALNGDVLSNALSFLGNDHLGEVIPMFGPNAGAVAHSMDYMSMVIDVYNNILKSFDSTTDYRDISQGFRSNINISENSNGDVFTKTIEFLSEVGIYETGVSGLKYNFLSEMTASQIQSDATNNRAAMFALLKLNGFAVEGNLTAYADMDLAKYSEKYIEKRSLFLYHLLDPDNRALGDIYIKDQGYGISAGSSGFFSDNSKIIFGSESVSVSYQEVLSGGNKNDFLFGMDGDDILIGEEGNDYLEGGQGSDILVGGENYDTYVVDNGDQVYDSDGIGEVIFNNYVLEEKWGQATFMIKFFIFKNRRDNAADATRG